MESAAGAPAVSTIALDVTPVRPAELNPSVTLPVAPMMARLVKVAVPAELVVTVVVPASEPVPDAIAAVTATPAWDAALPATSCNCTTGCGVSSCPLSAKPGGWVVMASLLAVPAETANGLLVAEVRPGDVTRKVY